MNLGRLGSVLCGLGGAAALGCTPPNAALEPPPGSLLADPEGPFPPQLSEVGLRVGDATIDRAIAYEPAFALWSSGSRKQRHLVLPQGESIDNASVPWAFPVGTVIFKEFALHRTIETRLLRRGAEGWDYAVYAWDDDGAGATLLELDFPTPVAAQADDGSTFEYNIPAELECRECHEGSPTAVLGLSELQLGDALEELHDRTFLSMAPPATLPTIEHPDPTTQDVLRYFQGNCVHCHNGGTEPSSAFDLRADAALANIIDQPTESSGTVAGIRVVPGAPQDSVLFRAVTGTDPDPELEEMPPVGIDVVDAEFVDLLRQWITELD